MSDADGRGSWTVGAALNAVMDLRRPDRWTLRGYGVAVSVAMGAGCVGLIASVAAVEWAIAVRGVGDALPPGTVALALGVPGAMIVLVVGSIPAALSYAIRSDIDPIVELAARARQIASGSRADIPYTGRSDLRGDLARALRDWQGAAAHREVLLQSAPVGIICFEGRVVKEANAAALATLRYRKEELEGADILELTHPDHRAQTARLAPGAMAAAGVEELAVEMQLRRGDGTWLWCSAVVAPIPEGGTPGRYVAIIEDISERKRQAQRAAAVQREMLPNGVPRIEGYEVAGAFLPAQEVGGDLYDWVELGEGGLDLTVADVMGKGMGAALVMAALRAALRTAPPELGPAARLAAAAGAVTFGSAGDELLVTVFHARLDGPSGRLSYVDAGHGYCLVRRASGRIERLPVRSLPLGVATAADLQQGEVELRPGDMLVACSDGLMETAEDTTRLDAAVAGLTGEDGANGAVRRLTGRLGPRLADDVALLVLKRTDPAAPGPAELSAAPAARAPGPAVHAPPAVAPPTAPPPPAGASRVVEDTMWNGALLYAITPYSGPPTLGLLVSACLVALLEWRLGAGGAGRTGGPPLLVAVLGPAAVGLLWFVPTVLLGIASARKGHLPLRALARCARRIAEGTWTPIPYTWRADEPGDLARALLEWQDAAALREVLVRSAPVGIVRVEPNGLVGDANPAVSAILGYRRDELVGTDLVTLLHQDDLHRVADVTARLEGRVSGSASAEVRLRRRDGTWLWCSAVVALVSLAGVTLHSVVVILEDISERKRQSEWAAAVQREMLPDRVPELPGYELAGRLVPAQEVAGDLYDWVEHSDGYLDVTVADVMGKGAGAALVMAALRAALRTAPAELGPAARVGMAERMLTFGSDADTQFVTLFHGRLEIATGRLRYVDAGHGYCVIRRAGGDLASLGVRSLPLGVGLELAEGHTALEPGDTLVLCSDGLMETGVETVRLEDVLAGMDASDDASTVVSQLMGRVGERLGDDATAVVLRRLAP